MDNEQLLDKVQNLLLGMEERVNVRFDAVDRRFDAVDRRFDAVDRRFEAVDRRFNGLETKLDSLTREVALSMKCLPHSSAGATGLKMK